MVVLEYCAKHNMIAYLEKIKENAQFHEIVDFLSRSLIFYALTVSPDVCVSFIEQFWKTATFKTINNISQIHAKVAGKPVVITEASIRGDLLFNDVDKKKLSKRKSVSKQGRKNAKSRPTKDGSDKLDAELDEDMEYIDTEEALNEGRQSTVDTAWLDVSTARPDDDTARPDASSARQELSTADPTTTPTTTTIFDDEEMTLADTLIKLKDDKAKGVAFKDSESTYKHARSILTLKPLPTIDPKDKGKGVLEEHTLIKLKDDKAKGVAFKDSESTYKHARSILTLKPLPTIDPKDKGKGVLEERKSAKKITKSDFDVAQIARDEEIARQMEEEEITKAEYSIHRIIVIFNKVFHYSIRFHLAPNVYFGTTN
nr:hypothetical protein [Tanacetum cinerariifolium]